MNRRVLITGSSGYLGRHLLLRAPSDWDIIACYWRTQPLDGPQITPVRIDIRDRNAVRALVEKTRPNLILHTAIARQPELFDAVIVQGTAHVAEAAAEHGARLIHLSTDILFDGTANKYDERALPNPEPAAGQPDPLSPHGRAKARAENLVRNLHPEPVIVRTSLIYGFDPLDHSTRWLAEGLRAGRRVTLFTDQIRCPIYVIDLAACLWELAALDFVGTIHLVGPVALSRYEFGLILCQILDLDTSHIVATPTPPDFVAPRRLDLRTDLAASLLHTRPRSPYDLLAE